MFKKVNNLSLEIINDLLFINTLKIIKQNVISFRINLLY